MVDAKIRKKTERDVQAEFDAVADSYYDQHSKNIALTGEPPEYYSRYKIFDLYNSLPNQSRQFNNILDFGCGIGNSIPHFREFFENSILYCSDLSARSMEIAQCRFPGKEKYIKIDNRIPLSENSVNIAFTACVFHHIPPSEHHKWLSELRRVTKAGGLLALYEHNPLNPLTLRAVNTCPFDVNAILIEARDMRDRVARSGWKDVTVEYKIFFPSFLKYFRRFESYLAKIPIGAQYRILARRA